MKTHIEDINNDDLGMEQHLKNWFTFVTRCSNGERRLLSDETYYTPGMPLDKLATSELWELKDALPTLVLYGYQGYLQFLFEFSEVSAQLFAQYIYRGQSMIIGDKNAIPPGLHTMLKRVYESCLIGRLEICGEWRGWRTYVKPASFLQWARVNGLPIPEELLPLLEANADPAKGRAVPEISTSMRFRIWEATLKEYENTTETRSNDAKASRIRHYMHHIDSNAAKNVDISSTATDRAANITEARTKDIPFMMNRYPHLPPLPEKKR